MFQLERQERILTYINNNKKANTEQLANEFDVSKVTIRRDIETLSGKGLILKTHGGAMALKNSQLFEIPYTNKVSLNIEAKKRIGICAAKLIEDGDIIILDSGSTTLEIAKNINSKNITVITNDIMIAMELAYKKNIDVIVSGGHLSDAVYTLTGNKSTECFNSIHVNKTFLGCDAIDLDFGVSNRTYDETDVKTAMINAAEEVIMVTDDSKLNKKVFCFLCDINMIDKLIINKLDDTTKDAFIDKGVEIVIAE